ncbi:serine hydrolase domain-containing protein [Micromonospora sp. BQ11]|uniref:serine hydrolase domain-containing protein n=1 Tax=Micromonospora sp. BQ11 TaxID=3452212 RepID=UPI003F88FCB8
MRRPTAIALVIGVLAALVAFTARPGPPRLGDRTTGDTALAAEVREAVGDPAGHRGLAVAVIESGRVRTAGLGRRGPDGGPVEPGTPFEIGSVTKVLTGMLLADQAGSGAVRPEDTLGAALPEVTGPSRDVTLAELASHRSGLPRLAIGSPLDLARILWANLTAGNPYTGWDADRIVDAAGDEEPGDDRGTVAYSNFGTALLGQALAGRAGTPYPKLLDREILRPLGMTRTVVADGSAPEGAAAGSKAGGRPADEWTAAGYAPAGVGVWSTVEDLARLVAAMLDGTAPGADAATPRFRDDDRRRVGYGWFTTRYADREVVWHNGGTGGFRSYVGFERATGRGVVVLGNTERDVDPIGLRLLGVPGEEADGEGGAALPVWAGAGLAVILTFLGGLSLLVTSRRGPDRLTLVAGTVWAGAYVALGHRLGDWSVVPGALWPLGVGVSAAAVVLSAYRWRDLPLVARAPMWRRATGVVLSTAAAVTLVGLVLG